MRFTAFDFETASSRPDSACAIGIAVFEDGALADTYYSVICPPDKYFSPFCTRIHGLTLADAEGCGDFAAHWPAMEKYFRGQAVFAHFARFDMGVLKAVLSRFGLPAPDFTYGCTCELSRRFFPRLENHRLNTVCAHLRIPLDHHNALSDAVACGSILAHVLGKSGNPPLEELFAGHRLKLRGAFPETPAPSGGKDTGIGL